MPRATKSKFYAVRVGREGPKIYTTWDECKKNTERWPGAIHKSFISKTEADQWLQMMRPPEIMQPSAGSSFCVADRNQPLPSSQSSVRNDDLPDQIASNEDSTSFKSRPAVVLSTEQKKVLQMVQEGRNVFFTGSAGTGKSVLLREIIKALGGRPSSTLGITASTGIAAVNIGGATLHSWAGIGLGLESAEKLAGKIAGQPKLEKVRERWRTTRTLIIDEISMIDGILFDKLDYIGKYLRRNDAPFGGIQVVLSGDFCQLPPVSERYGDASTSCTFAFDAQGWNRCVGLPVHLTRVFRQKDQDFIDMLNAMRFGQLDAHTIAEFKNLSRPVVYDDGIEPTELFATRREVDTANTFRLNQLPSAQIEYQSQDVPGYDSKGERMSQEQMERILDRLVAPKSIGLKVGAQVMLIKNLIQGTLVNGSVGQVVGFATSREAMENRTEIAKADDTPAAKLAAVPSERSWPVVRFTSGKQMLIIPAEFTVVNAQGDMEARRDQIPLILAWALSIHKSQGQTLERVSISLDRIFEKGQAYVALSRATSMSSLQVLHFSPSKVMAHPRVLEWQDELHQEAACVGYEDEMDNEEAIASYYTHV